MTQLDNSHDLLHAENKDRIYKHNKMTNKIKDKEYINALYKIVDKLEQRISKLERVLESHAKCIGQLREEKKDDIVN